MEGDSEMESTEQDTPESEAEETEKVQEKLEQLLQYTTEKNPTPQTAEKRKIQIFDYLNSEQDAKENRN